MSCGAVIVIVPELVPEAASIVLPSAIVIAPTLFAAVSAVTVTFPLVDVTMPADVKVTLSPAWSVIGPALLVTAFAMLRLLPLPVALSVIGPVEAARPLIVTPSPPVPAASTVSAPAAVMVMPPLLVPAFV
jgi:hypothetical protein